MRPRRRGAGARGRPAAGERGSGAKGHPAAGDGGSGAPNLLELTPVREAEWKDRDGWVVLERPAPTTRGLRRLADRLSYLMAPRRLRLDDMGSFSWKRFDGHTTVGEVCAALRDRFGESIEPAEERLARFVIFLHQDGFLSYLEM